MSNGALMSVDIDDPSCDPVVLFLEFKRYFVGKSGVSNPRYCVFEISDVARWVCWRVDVVFGFEELKVALVRGESLVVVWERLGLIALGGGWVRYRFCRADRVDRVNRVRELK
jgi:hypothetical protein